MEYLKAFVFGGLICVAGQLLIDLTRLTPARILVLFVAAAIGLGTYAFLLWKQDERDASLEQEPEEEDLPQ